MAVWGLYTLWVSHVNKKMSSKMVIFFSAEKHCNHSTAEDEPVERRTLLKRRRRLVDTFITENEEG